MPCRAWRLRQFPGQTACRFYDSATARKTRGNPAVEPPAKISEWSPRHRYSRLPSASVVAPRRPESPPHPAHSTPSPSLCPRRLLAEPPSMSRAPGGKARRLIDDVMELQASVDFPKPSGQARITPCDYKIIIRKTFAEHRKLFNISLCLRWIPQR